MEDPAFGTVMVGVLKVCCVSITIFIVDRFGRKKLMILSLAGKDSCKLLSSPMIKIDNSDCKSDCNIWCLRL